MYLELVISGFDHKRLNVQKDALRDILVERRVQDHKWKHPADRSLSLPIWQLVLSEETGEVAQAILKGANDSNGMDKLRYELVQVAATALAIIEAIEANATDFGIKPEDAG
jgi:NTP pyrophosphatase (non-canonical NTP hydrolase)